MHGLPEWRKQKPQTRRLFVALFSIARYQTKVPTALLFSADIASLPWCEMLKVCRLRLSLSTTRTCLPSGALKATLGSVGSVLDAMRTEPGRTNLAACAM